MSRKRDKPSCPDCGAILKKADTTRCAMCIARGLESGAIEPGVCPVCCEPYVDDEPTGADCALCVEQQANDDALYAQELHDAEKDGGCDDEP